MSDNSTASPRVGDKPVLVLAGCCLLALMATVLVHRFTHPFLDVRDGSMHQKMDQGPMADIARLMQQVEEHPEDLDALRALGNAFMHMQAWDRALSFWDRVLQIEPHDVMALNQKGVCLFRQQDYPASAETFARLIELDPDNVYALFNMGVLHRHFLGNPEKGNGFLQKILKMEGVSPDILQAVRQELDQSSSETSQTP
jgi:tetratricopeptide (TPR) repeat protein